MKNLASSITKKNFPFVLIAILGILMFWDKGENFFTPNTFNINGDTAFPLNMNYVDSFLYSWDLRGNFGLGQGYTMPFQLPMYFIVWLWSAFGLPLWIANRLWHILPNIFIGLGAFYLYRSFFNSKYSWVCGTIASVFIMLLPDRNIFPHGGTGFAGTLFILGALTRGLFAEYTGSSKRYTAAIFSLGIVMAIHYIRCLYITIIIIGLIMFITICCYKRRGQNHVPIIRFIGACAVLTLLFNLFWIIPLIPRFLQGAESLFPSGGIIEAKKTFNMVHQKMTNPLYLLRATTGGAGLGRPSYYYFSHPLILPFSFLIPLFCFLPLLLKNLAKRTRFLVVFSILLSFYPASFHFSPAFNMFLRNYIPTFWIMNDPSYWLLYVGTCYGLIIGSMTEYFLNLLESKMLKKTIFIGCVSIVVIIFGGGPLFDRPLIPGFVHDYTLFGTKFPYVKIPDEYDEAEKYLDKNARVTDRIWYIDTGSFKRYTWAYNGHMPEILFFKSPITTVGRGMSFVSPMVDLLLDSVDSNKYNAEEGLVFSLLMGKIMNIRYIFIHKDYYDKSDIDLNNYVRKNVEKNSTFRVVMDTDSFILYENKDPSLSLIYPVIDATLVVGGVGMLSLIAQDKGYMERPLFLFAEQMQSKQLEVRDIGINNMVFGESNRQNLPIEIIKDAMVIIVNRAAKEKQEKLIWQGVDQSEVEVWHIFDQQMEFYITQEGDYIIKARVSPLLVKKKLKGEIGPEFRFGIEGELKDWSISPREVTYDYSITEDSALFFSLYFDGNEKEDEFVQMQNIREKVDLKKYPWFGLVYKVENSDVQTIEVVAGIDFDKDGMVNYYFRSIYPRPASEEWTNFNFSLYHKIKVQFPDEKYYDIVWLELYPHKLWGVDCSSPERRGEYRFWIKKLQFYNLVPLELFEVIENVLDVRIDSAEELKKWAIEYKHEDCFLEIEDGGLVARGYMPYLLLSRHVDKINLKQFHMIELEYSTRDSNISNVELILGIDFDGDGVTDEDVSIGCLPDSKEFQIDAYKTLQCKFPDKPEYYLTWIKLRLNDFGLMRELWQKKVVLFHINRLRIYSYRLLASLTGFNFCRPIIELDGEEYWFSKKIESDEDVKDLLFEQTVHLGKGKHCLKKVIDKRGEVGRVILEPKTKIQNPESKEPEIIFKKINPSKYEVQVLGAKEPFWLVLSESFHKQWKIYIRQKPEWILWEYVEHGLKESKHTKRFTPLHPESPSLQTGDEWQIKNSSSEKPRSLGRGVTGFTPNDIKYLFKKSLNLEHRVVNGYANGWYIDPRKLNLDEDFCLIMYFWPQGLFYIGLGISGLSILGFIVFVIIKSMCGKKDLL